MQDLRNAVVQLQNRLSDVQERLSYWTNPDSVNDVEILNKIEDSVNESLHQIRMQKEKVANEHFVKVDSNNQLQNDLELPFHVNEEPQLQDLSTWISFDDMPHMAVPEELKLPSQRDVGCFTGQSFTGPFGYFNMCTKESVNPSQEISFGANLSQQVPFSLNGQYPYPCGFNMMGGDRGFQHLLGMDLNTNTLDYDFEGQCQPLSVQPRNDTSSSHNLPMSCGDSLFGEHLNSQNGTRIPTPMAPSMYNTVANDPSRMLYDLLNAPN